MRRLGAFLMAVGLVLALSAAAAVAGGNDNDWGSLPAHGHVMLIGVEVDEAAGEVHFDRCVELASGKALSTRAHHNSLHTGVPGGSPMVQGALYKTGKWVVPLAPLTGYTGCEGFESPFELPPPPAD